MIYSQTVKVLVFWSFLSNTLKTLQRIVFLIESLLHFLGEHVTNETKFDRLLIFD